MARLALSSAAMFVLALLPFVLGSATRQFHLDVYTQVSDCWMTCHESLTSTLPLEGVTVNSRGYIDRNCRTDIYIAGMSTCLASQCDSAPAAAYGAEYATSICKRAGVDVEISLPESYIAAASESEAYTSRGVRGVKNWGLDWAFLLVLPPVVLYHTL